MAAVGDAAAMAHAKVAIVSDIHGNLRALQACLDDAAAQGAERLWCLGDVVGYGARPMECLAIIRERDAVLIRGNHEQAVLDGPLGFNPLAAAAIQWTRTQLENGGTGGEALEFLRALPERVDTEAAVLVHGSPASPVDEYLFPEDALDQLPRGLDYSPKLARCFGLIDRPCFVGHTHVPGIITRDMRWTSPADCGGVWETGGLACIINVGSVGQPRDGDVRAAYAIFDGETATLRRVPYDVQGTVDEILAVPDLPDLLAHRLLEGW
jgi:diadenosine tetraphosphatase ApaH/serine/threonine PP2A family protein phosphatase